MYLGRMNYTRAGLRQLKLLESDFFPTINFLLATFFSLNAERASHSTGRNIVRI